MKWKKSLSLHILPCIVRSDAGTIERRASGYVFVADGSRFHAEGTDAST